MLASSDMLFFNYFGLFYYAPVSHSNKNIIHILANRTLVIMGTQMQYLMTMTKNYIMYKQQDLVANLKYDVHSMRKNMLK